MPKVTIQDVLAVKTANVQATHSASPKHARSESVVVVNPTNSLRMVGASKRFINPEIYDFTLATCYSIDGGRSWIESAPLALGHDTFGRPWGGISDPALTWDSQGNVFLVALPFAPNDGPAHSIAVYKSVDGGASWSAPNVIHSGSDDKQWTAGDLSPSSPFFGNVYAVWDVGHALCFARTTDHGVTWKGAGNKSIAETVLADDSFSPEISVGPDGAIYIVYWNRYSSTTTKSVKLVKSTDGGDTFSAPIVVAEGITDLEAVLPEKAGWHHFPGNTFRVLTIATGCIGLNNALVVAWADGREIVGVSDVTPGFHVSRIYYRRSPDGGTTWEGAASGQPLLARVEDHRAHYFHPQIISAPDGRIGCAFYELGYKTGKDNLLRFLIDVKLAASLDGGQTFSLLRTVNTLPWDPAVGAPLVHGQSGLTFIGEYFGLDASSLGFTLLWTDTRTGMQELFSATLAVEKEYRVEGDLGGIIFGGVDVDAGGWIVLPNGKIKKVPPHEPAIDILRLLDVYESAKGIEDHAERTNVQREALKSIERIIQRALHR